VARNSIVSGKEKEIENRAKSNFFFVDLACRFFFFFLCDLLTRFFAIVIVLHDQIYTKKTKTRKTETV